jgi:ligand-binding sensor domain-containing protein/class 3 adenylate cyclase
MKQGFRILLFMFIPLLLGSSGFCQTTTAGNKRFYHLNEGHGLSQNSVSCILQDRDGFMWFGTPYGLNKFDGYFFTTYVYSPLDSTTLPKGAIRCLYEDKDGILWIGISNTGLVAFNKKTEKFEVFKSSPLNGHSLSSNDVVCIRQDKEGILWLGTEGGGLNRFDPHKKSFSFYKNDANQINSISSNIVYSIVEGEDGLLWIGTFGGGLNSFDRKTGLFKRYMHDPSRLNSLSSNRVDALYEDRGGILWIGTVGGGLNSYDKKKDKFTIYKKSGDGTLSNNNVTSIVEDNSGNLWLGTISGGLNILNKKRDLFNCYKNDPLNTYSICGNRILSIYEDRQGSLWVGTEGEGISVLDKNTSNFIKYFSNSDAAEVAAAGRVLGIFEDRKGTLWIGTENKLLNALNKTTGKIEHYKINEQNQGILNESGGIGVILEDQENADLLWLGIEGSGLATFDKRSGRAYNYQDKEDNASNNSNISCLLDDGKGFIWIGTYGGGLSVFNKKTKTFKRYIRTPKNESSISSNNIRCLYLDNKNILWIGTEGGGLNFFDMATREFGNYKHNALDTSSISNNVITCLYEDKEGILWIGNTGGGLDAFDKEKKTVRRHAENQSLKKSIIYGILPDDKGNLWLSTTNGIVKFTQSSSDPVPEIKFYTIANGLPSNEFNSGVYCSGRDGWMYFGSEKGLVAFQPNKLTKNINSSKVGVTQFRVFDKPLLTDSNIFYKKKIRLSYQQNFFSIRFASLSYAFNEKNTYAYKMVGFDKEWIDAGARNEATYANLSPGKYHFLVRANNGGIWSPITSSLAIVITPPFWQTTWFFLLVVFIILFIVYIVIKIRERNLKMEKKILEEEISRRTHQISLQNQELEAQRDALTIEKDISDKLLLNILPAETAEELKTKGSASVRNYRLVTVLFTDFKGFSSISETMRPKDLIEELNRCFMAFDDITEHHQVEKIKTIGDSYMCAGGIPIRNKSNPIDTLLAAFEIKRFMEDLRKIKEAKGEPYWDIRIGLHTGEIIAGVVGKRKFAYDIWGDTVNIASRMESSGEPGKINISGWSYELIKNYFDCTYRGKIPAKNKGEIDMYFVDSIKPDLSVDGLGIVPNETFLKLLTNI